MADGQVVFEITAEFKELTQTLRECTSAIERASQKWDSSFSDVITDFVSGFNRGFREGIAPALQDVTRQAGTMSDQVEGAVNDMEGAAEKSANSMTKAFSRAFDIERVKNFAINAAKHIAAFVGDSIGAASDLAEAQNVVDVTFEGGAAQIETWSKKAQSQFGLTEIQAKRFTSTLGAMMKSAGLAGPEIVSMSTDLAGLAADMASFYNMDFETAFNKIRSGIAGQTMPLRELGINMSVANVEAFALEKGITKAFDKMSQGEQTMLRYQYLMQATADAQGDFSRTADGYANAQRRVQTAIESIKTSVGTVFYNSVAKATDGLATFLEAISQPKHQTVLDEVAAIDLKTQEKINEIKKTANEAGDLLNVLEKIAGSTDAGAAMKSLAEGANALNAGSPATWRGLLKAMESVEGLSNIFSNSSAGQNVEDLAAALSGASVDTDKAEAWRTFLAALQDNAGALTALTGKSAEETSDWLSSIAAAANELTPANAEGWNKLLSNFVTGLPGLQDTEGGKAFFDAMALNFLAMGTESEEATAGLLALGLSTQDIDTAQKQWLETCRKLVKTIPGLSSIINTQTGEIEGGADAVSQYVEEWRQGQEKMLLWEAHFSKERALNERKAQEYSYQLDMWNAEARAESARKRYEELGGDEAFRKNVTRNVATGWWTALNEQGKELIAASTEIYEANKELEQATALYNQELEANAAVTKAVSDEYNMLAGKIGLLEDAATGAEDSMTKLQLAATGDAAALADVQAAVKGAAEAFKNLADYQDNVRSETAQTVRQMVNGFQSVVTPADETRNKMDDLTRQIEQLNAAGKDSSGLEITKANLNGTIPSIQNMTKALQGQLDYMNKYKAMLDEARNLGVSEEILAFLSDGSAESFDYLEAITTTKGNITDAGGLNDLYRQVQEASEGFTDTLTNQKLAADSAYDELVQKANQSIADLNLGEAAKESVAATVQGIVDGLSENAASVKEQVDSILADLARLAGASYGVNVTGGLGVQLTPDGSHAGGLDYVPFDNYLSILHEGESVLTAEEARVWRNFKYGAEKSANSFDYGTMSTAVWENAPSMGGNVYLDGQTVGRVMAAQQANSYRALERSGWQG